MADDPPRRDLRFDIRSVFNCAVEMLIFKQGADIMGWILIVLRLIPKVAELMKIAEKLFDSIPDSGPQKKEYVLAAIKAIVEGITGFTGDEWDAIWGKIYEAVDSLIDIFAVFLFPHDDKEG